MKKIDSIIKIIFCVISFPVSIAAVITKITSRMILFVGYAFTVYITAAKVEVKAEISKMKELWIEE